MFIDASAVVAIVGKEADAEELLGRIQNTKGARFVSPLVLYEATTSLASKYARETGRQRDPELLSEMEDAVRPFFMMIRATEMAIDSSIGAMALDAARSFGRIINHPADLNFGDCFAHACAKARDIPLLYKGNDFRQTDLA